MTSDITRHSVLTGQTSYMVDGALVSSFPVQIFDRTDGRPGRWPTFRVALTSALEPRRPAPELQSHLDVVRALVHTALHGRANTERQDPDVATRTVCIDTRYVSATDFALDRDVRQRLFDDGYAAATAFLERMAVASRTLESKAP